MMLRLARTLLYDQEEAMDTVQDVLEKLWRKQDIRRNIRNPSAFAMQSVRNACIDRKDTSATFPEIEQRPGAESWSDAQLVREAMKLLPEKQKTVLHLKDIEGFPTDEIAGMLGTGENQVRVTLSRARKAMREIILKELGTKDDIRR